MLNIKSVKNIDIWNPEQQCWTSYLNEVPENGKVETSVEEGFQFQILNKNSEKIKSSNHTFTAKFFTWLIQQKKYSQLLTDALNKYRNRSIETSQVIEELIQMAKDFRTEKDRGQNLGLNNDELVFYDALSDNDSAKEVLGNEILKKMAHELTEQLRKSVTIDWAKRESVRANIRLKINKLLKKYKYPPDKEDAAVKLVLEQAETLSQSWIH